MPHLTTIDDIFTTSIQNLLTSLPSQLTVIPAPSNPSTYLLIGLLSASSLLSKIDSAKAEKVRLGAEYVRACDKIPELEFVRARVYNSVEAMNEARDECTELLKEAADTGVLRNRYLAAQMRAFLVERLKIYWKRVREHDNAKFGLPETEGAVSGF